MIAANGCDSIVLLNLTINYDDESIDSVVTCDSYEWNGNVYNESGTYSFETNTANGCDSTAILDLTINYAKQSFDSLITCDSYGTEIYNTESGTYSFETNTVNGCDSTAILDLTINYIALTNLSIV